MTYPFDFNAMVTKTAPRESKRALALFERLESLGLRSAYHASRQIPHGNEPDPTHYFLWKRERPFHIDYCFVPRTWEIRSVNVGAHDVWGKLSDHVPLIVDLAPAGSREIACERS